MFKPDWSQLPQELLAIICNNSKTNLEYLRFRSVCRSWRSSASQTFSATPIYPLPDIPHDYAATCFHKDYNLDDVEEAHINPTPSVYSLVESNIYIMQTRSSSSKSWFIKLHETKPNVLEFLSPLSRSPIRSLPQMFAKELNTLETKFRISGICKEYHLERRESHYESIIHDHALGHGGLPAQELHLLDRFVLKQVVLSPSSTTTDFVVMAIHHWGSVIIYKSGDKGWNTVKDQRAAFHDVAHYRGNFYVVDGAGSTYIADPTTLKLIQLVWPFSDDGGERKRLVVSDGELFLVDVYMDKKRRPEEWCEIRARNYQWKEVISSPEFLSRAPLNGCNETEQSSPKFIHFSVPVACKIFKLDQKNRKWRRVESLGGHIFCVGDRSTFSVSPSEFPSDCSGNCVLFADACYYADVYSMEYDDALNHDVMVFNMEDHTFRNLRSYPNYLQLFWPPPSLG